MSTRWYIIHIFMHKKHGTTHMIYGRLLSYKTCLDTRIMLIVHVSLICFDIYGACEAEVWSVFCDFHDDVIKRKHFPRYWPFVRGIHRSPVNSLHKGHWRGALMFSMVWARINGWVNDREIGDLRRHYAHYDVTVITVWFISCMWRCHIQLIIGYVLRTFHCIGKMFWKICATEYQTYDFSGSVRWHSIKSLLKQRSEHRYHWIGNSRYTPF